ncbi:MAG: triose-phosphate isomerase [Candidatus Aminicenantales bacterium]
MSGKAPFIAGNWKMHATPDEARALTAAIVKEAPAVRPAVFVVIPPFTLIGEVSGIARNTPVLVGGQDLFWQEKGAFTGEVSASMLKDAGCSCVIIGHSERRQFFGETDETVNKKIGAALRHGLSPIVCIGESLEEREAGNTMTRIQRQLDEGLRGFDRAEAGRIIIAYEPLWAIGTGRTATPEQAEEVHAFIRKNLEEKYGNETSACAIILYGGSVKPAGAYSLFKKKNIDGFLVGGASLEAGSFIQIAKEARRAYEEEIEK